MTTPQLLTPRRINVRLADTEGNAIVGATGSAMLVNAYGLPVLSFSAATKHGVWSSGDLPLVEDGGGIYHVDLLSSETLADAQYQLLVLNPGGDLRYSKRFDVPDGDTPLELADLVTVSSDSVQPTPDQPTEGVTDAELTQAIELHRQQSTGHQPQLASGAFSQDGTGLTLTFTDDSTIEIGVPEILRGMIDESVFATRTALNTAISELQTADTTLANALGAKADSSALSQEVTARVSGDAALQTNIGAEATTRAGADTALSGRIDTEVADRTAGDRALNTRIDEYEPADNSITPAKAQANSVEQKRAWRERLASAHVSTGTTLPALSESNLNDFRVLIQEVTSGISFVDIRDSSTELTSAKAGDIMWVLMLRDSKQWVRVGNVLREDDTGLVFLDDGTIPASANTVGMLRLRHGRLYITRPVYGTTKAVTFRDPSFVAGDLRLGETWGGILEDAGDPSGESNGVVVYDLHTAKWRMITSQQWLDYSNTAVTSIFRGIADNEDGAKNLATAVGDIVGYGGTMYVVHTYVDRAPDRYEYELLQQDILDTLLALTATLQAARMAADAAGTTASQALSTAQTAQNSIAALVETQALVPAARLDWDVDSGARAFITLDRNIILSLSGGADGDFAVLRATQDATGGRVITWDNSVGGSRGNPALSTGNGDVDLLLFTNILTAWHYIGNIADA